MVVIERKWLKIALIEKMAYKTANAFKKHIDEEYMSNIVSQKKQKELKLNKDECIDIISYSLQIIYGELIKFIIVLLIAGVWGLFYESIMTIIGFSLLRSVAGGVHMKSFERCLIATSVTLLGTTYLTLLISNSIVLIASIGAISIFIAQLYAPLGSEEKPLDTYDEKKKYKRKSKIYILIFILLSFILYMFNFEKISLALALGVLMECITLTPIGVKVFNKLEKILEYVV